MLSVSLFCDYIISVSLYHTVAVYGTLHHRLPLWRAVNAASSHMDTVYPMLRYKKCISNIYIY